MLRPMLRILVIVLGVVAVSAQMTPAATFAQEDSADVSIVAVVGGGTAASCQTQSARNALSNAVAAGGTITFNCGAAPVVMPVNTKPATTPAAIAAAPSSTVARW